MFSPSPYTSSVTLECWTIWNAKSSYFWFILSELNGCLILVPLIFSFYPIDLTLSSFFVILMYSVIIVCLELEHSNRYSWNCIRFVVGIWILEESSAGKLSHLLALCPTSFLPWLHPPPSSSVCLWCSYATLCLLFFIFLDSVKLPSKMLSPSYFISVGYSHLKILQFSLLWVYLREMGSWEAAGNSGRYWWAEALSAKGHCCGTLLQNFPSGDKISVT